MFKKLTGALFMLAILMHAPAVFACGGEDHGETAAKQDEVKLVSVTIDVTKLTCECERGTTADVKKIDGIKAVSVNVKKGTITVKFDDKVTSSAQIRSKLTEMGYVLADANEKKEKTKA